MVIKEMRSIDCHLFSVNRISSCSSNQGGSQEHISCGVLIMSVSAVLLEKSRGNKMCDED